MSTRLKYVPGDHYIKAHEAVASKEYGVLGTENGEIVASGTIAEKQMIVVQTRTSVRPVTKSNKASIAGILSFPTISMKRWLVATKR